MTRVTVTRCELCVDLEGEGQHRACWVQAGRHEAGRVEGGTASWNGSTSSATLCTLWSCSKRVQSPAEACE